MNADVCAEIEVERELLATAFEGALERLLAGVDELVTLELGRLHKGLATFVAHVDAWAVRVQVFAHGGVVSEELVAADVWAVDLHAVAVGWRGGVECAAVVVVGRRCCR